MPYIYYKKYLAIDISNHLQNVEINILSAINKYYYHVRFKVSILGLRDANAAYTQARFINYHKEINKCYHFMSAFLKDFIMDELFK